MLVLDRVSQLVDQNPHAFITGDRDLADAALRATKYIFDLSLQRENTAHAHVMELIQSCLEPEPDMKRVTRSHDKAAVPEGKEWHSSIPLSKTKTNRDTWELTPIDSLLLDGMDDDQIWAQLELRTANVCKALKSFLEGDPVVDTGGLSDGDEEREEEYGEGDDDDDEDGDEEDEEGFEDFEEDEMKDIRLADEDLPEKTTSLHDPSDEETATENEEDDLDLDKPPSVQSRSGAVTLSSSKSKHPVLDDEFFSLADFKAEVESAEANHISRGRLGHDDEDEEDEDIESDIDLFAAVEETGFDEADLDSKMAYYDDFFTAPKKLQSNEIKLNGKRKILISKPKQSVVRFNDEVKVRNIKSTGKGLSLKDMTWQAVGDKEEEGDEDDEDFPQAVQDNDEGGSEDDQKDSDEESQGSDEDDVDEDEGRGAIERFKDDLFADDEEEEGTLKDISTHEAHQAEIAAQIKQLEAENVAPKAWTLMGEATTRSRPINSLLEEDLEFDRVLKVAPVVTEESVSSLEEMIKKRILDNKFDDVVRKRPVDDKPFLPSRLFELEDKKSSKGLAEIYADEYTAAASGTSTEVRDEKLKRQHAELNEMWENICYKLDALSNAHFTPKPPKATITTISNVAAASLESALPTTVSTTTMFTPEEMYTPDASSLRSKEEMAPSEKKSLRNQKRKARRKAHDMINSAKVRLTSSNSRPSAKSTKKGKEKILESVVKTGKGVSIVGKQKQKDKPVTSKGFKL